MNVRDSEVVAGLLQKSGYKICDSPDSADVIIFNTCSVRQHAEDKVWSEIGRLAKSKKMGTVPKRRGQSPFFKPIIGLIGCMAQNYKETAFERSPDIDFVVGPADIAKIPDILEKLSQKRGQKRGQSPKKGDSPLFFSSHFFERKIWETDSEIRPEEIYHTGFYEDKEHAFVVISEGCSNFCSYCVVPYVRGALRHRNYEDILREINEAVDKGITKITLLGQNVNAYVSPGKMGTVPKRRGQSPFFQPPFFIELLELVNRIKGIKEFSFITSHPKDTSVDLFKAMADLEKLRKYLHLPVQSGSDRILKLMNRNYTRKFYLDLADNYRRIVNDGVLTTDVIVGFPTESEVDFLDTLDLVKDIRFNAAYIFKYSPRPHTEAAKMADRVEKEEKEKRHRMILELQKEISNKVKNEKLK
ncbi:MAG: MiaB/RimO family radical SAM methylthiotransferase [Candidatus Omnitrophota bacterium]|nr:MiaB/RimO family radical SAM methylthiotransferase [Candidatus Omnitrophota bacterium]